MNSKQSFEALTYETVYELSDLLKKVCEAATELDIELCTVLNRGTEAASIPGERYEELLDYVIEAEKYLRKCGVEI